MNWLEICVHSSREAIEPISNIFHEAGAGGVVIEDSDDLDHDWSDRYGEIYALNPDDYPEEGVNIKAYLPVNSFLAETVEEIKGAIHHLSQFDINLGDIAFSLSEINETSWQEAWKQYYKPVHVTDRLTIAPTWEAYQPQQADEQVIELDPGMAFGTGTHPTTVLSLQALEKYLQPGMRVLDVGTGSGILSIASAKLGAASVLGVDLDDVAVQVAEQNVALNQVQNRVEIRRNNLVNDLSGPYDIIVANILAEIIVRFLNDVPDRLAPNGRFIASGIIENKREWVRENIRKAGLEIVETMKNEHWITLVTRKA
ncbi:50S ribosomal protein L11 methyltransferase [Camelliibacillus cellulosilyticus]|uniref:Ribosomal protein L11 methyltransferase n=1 Tax=Camelliibacillus cellulosilyticus TaxID=2174486 RepID=A0ABV9GLJ9_9BACL